jgi:gas vesicle protein
MEFMADEQNSSGFSWFLAGLGAGALLGVLFAPKAGRETRDSLVSGAREGTEYLRQRSREAAGQMNQYVDRSKEYVDKGRAQWEEFVGKGRRYVNEQADKVSSAVEAGKEAYRQSAGSASAAVDAGKEAYRQSATGTTGATGTMGEPSTSS